MNDDTTKSNYPELIETVFEFHIPPGQVPERIDVYLSNCMKHATRTKVQKAIDEGYVTVNGKNAKSSKKIQPNDHIICTLMKSPPIQLIPEDIKLDIIYEDKTLLVINKPSGMVTHPGYGNRFGTVVNAVLYHIGKRESIVIDIDDEDDEDSNEGRIYASDDIRPGIVHRIDKNTSGLLVITKDSAYHPKLAEQFADRSIERYYYAIAWGDIKDDTGTIEGDIGRNPRDRKTFAVVKKGGKHAVTDFWVLERFGIFTLIKVKLRTGRTHQIRVHFSNNKHPLLGDPEYGGDKLLYGAGIPEQKKIAEQCLKLASRQMLHAKILGFSHPVSGDRLSFESELPEDFQNILNVLRTYQSKMFE